MYCALLFLSWYVPLGSLAIAVYVPAFVTLFPVTPLKFTVKSYFVPLTVMYASSSLAVPSYVAAFAVPSFHLNCTL